MFQQNLIEKLEIYCPVKKSNVQMEISRKRGNCTISTRRCLAQDKCGECGLCANNAINVTVTHNAASLMRPPASSL